MGVILCEFESRPPHKSLVERSGFFRVCSNSLFARRMRYAPTIDRIGKGAQRKKVGRLAQKAAMTSRLLPNRTTVTEIGSFITRWSPKHYKSTLINDHRDTFPSKYVTVVKDIIVRRRLDVNRETVILYAGLYAFYP